MRRRALLVRSLRLLANPLPSPAAAPWRASDALPLDELRRAGESGRLRFASRPDQVFRFHLPAAAPETQEGRRAWAGEILKQARLVAQPHDPASLLRRSATTFRDLREYTGALLALLRERGADGHALVLGRRALCCADGGGRNGKRRGWCSAAAPARLFGRASDPGRWYGKRSGAVGPCCYDSPVLLRLKALLRYARGGHASLECRGLEHVLMPPGSPPLNSLLFPGSEEEAELRLVEMVAAVQECERLKRGILGKARAHRRCPGCGGPGCPKCGGAGFLFAAPTAPAAARTAALTRLHAACLAAADAPDASKQDRALFGAICRELVARLKAAAAALGQEDTEGCYEEQEAPARYPYAVRVLMSAVCAVQLEIRGMADVWSVLLERVDTFWDREPNAPRKQNPVHSIGADQHAGVLSEFLIFHAARRLPWIERPVLVRYLGTYLETLRTLGPPHETFQGYLLRQNSIARMDAARTTEAKKLGVSRRAPHHQLRTRVCDLLFKLSSGVLAAGWACRLCTFENKDQESVTCEMCGSRRISKRRRLSEKQCGDAGEEEEEEGAGRRRRGRGRRGGGGEEEEGRGRKRRGRGRKRREREEEEGRRRGGEGAGRKRKRKRRKRRGGEEEEKRRKRRGRKKMRNRKPKKTNGGVCCVGSGRRSGA